MERQLGRRSALGIGLVFAVVGPFWIAMAISGEGDVHLILPGLVSILAAILLLIRARRWFIRSFAIATSVYNLLIFVYLAYSSISLIESGLTVFGSMAMAGYSFGFAVFVVVGLALYSKAEFFSPSKTRSGEDRSKSKDS